MSEIQRRASPLILQKHDTLVIAPTGSGKTECSVIPAFARAAASRQRGRTKALYITPLRALNRDVFRRIERYAAALGLTVAVRHGDTPRAARARIAASPPDVLITTPESLVVLLSQERALASLSELEWVIIDEVHELLPSERGAQLSISLERLARCSRRELTRVGLSATIGNASEAAKLVAGAARRCRIVRARSQRGHDVSVVRVAGGVPDVADEVLRQAAEHGGASPVLLFANTRGEAELLAAVLREKAAPLRVELHHGSLSRGVREESEDALRSGRGGIVVCTSSLELGIDVGSIELVVHYGSPRQVSRMLQRIGRSRHGRNAAARGVIIADSDDELAEARALLERARAGSLESQEIHEGALDVLAHHLAGMILQFGSISAGDALAMVSRAYAFRNTTLSDIAGVASMLERARVLRLDRKTMVLHRGRRLMRYHFENLTTIPDVLRFRVVDAATRSVIGTLDQRFVGDRGEPGNVFVLRGRQWRILNVAEDELRVNVEPHRGSGMRIPYWEGETIPVDEQTAALVGSQRARRAGGRAPGDSELSVESARSEGAIVIHSCAGTRINATLATLLSAALSASAGRIVEARSDAYRVALSSQARIGERALAAALHDTCDLEQAVEASIAGTHNVNWRSWCVAKRFGIVERGAVYDRRDARIVYERHLATPLSREALRELYHDKYDLRGTRRLLERVRSGEIAVTWDEVGSFSALAEPILARTAYRASPSSVDEGVLEMVRRRLLATKQRLVCARCGAWDRLAEAGEIGAPLSCPLCRARQVTASFRADDELPAIIRKKRAGGDLTDDESRRFRRAWKAASLVENFGRAALIALAGHGVGADTAARILRNMTGEEGLYRQVYEAERQYVMTRGFWDSD